MAFLDRFRRQRHPSDAEIQEIRNRVVSIRDRVGKREVGIADLFGLVGEDELGSYRSRQPEPPEPDPVARFWPHEIETRTEERFSTNGLADLLWPNAKPKADLTSLAKEPPLR